MKRVWPPLLIFLFGVAFVSCSGGTTASTTETENRDTYSYQSLSFPDFSVQNPVRYLDVDERDMEYNGWQDFGTAGEIQTHPWPWTTYTYQMYSYFIRNDLQQLYSDIQLPADLADLPDWVADRTRNGHRILWYSMMGSTLPDSVTLISVETLTSENGIQTFLRAEYQVMSEETEKDWIVYFMETDGIFSSFSIRVNEYYDTVIDTTDFLIQTYRIKTPVSD